MDNTNLHNVIDEHTKHIAELRAKQDLHGEHINRLDSAMSELRERFGTVATHDDVIRLQTKIDDSVNGLLRDALSAVPQKALVWFTAIMAAIALVDLVTHFTTK